MTWTPPVTLDGWESKLIDYFLRIGADGDAQNIRWFEVTPSTLAAAFADNDVSADEIEKAFQAYMSRIPDLPQRLESGMMEKSSCKSPGYFTYLVMTLLISSQFDAREESNDFRLKLQNWLGAEHNYQNLSGVNAMWKALSAWLEQRIQEGKPYRRLSLPEIPESWSHIGYTLRLAFPGKTDLRLMSNLLASHPQAVSSPRLLIEYFQTAINKKENVSYALNQAFNEFKDAWLLGRRALADMPFWHLRQRAIELSYDIKTHQALIDMSVDFDGSRCYFSALDGDSEAAFHPSLSEALSAVSAVSSENLGKAAQIGLLFFHQIGHGRWRAIAVPNEHSQQFHVALSCNHSIKMSKCLSDVIVDDDWLLTTHPQSRHSAMDIFRTVKTLPGMLDGQVTRPQFYGGIRVPGGWLGLPEFLPFIASDTRRYKIYSSGKDCADIEVSKTDGRLISLMSLNGEFFIEPVPETGERTPPWRHRVRFFNRAVPHPALGESARYRLEPLTDWATSPLKTALFHSGEPLMWEDGEIRCDHLLEALYASGVSGWEEAELFALLEPIADDVSVWHLIRCLHHAGLIEPRLRRAWKGRVWTLVNPSLLSIRNEENSLVVIEGAICANLLDDFQKAVSGLNGKCFRRKGVSVWSPPVFGAELDDPVTLSRRLGWPLIDAPPASDMTPFSFTATNRAAELHDLAAVWDWRSGRFQPHTGSEKGSTFLTRHVHPGGRDHDVYRVVSGRKTTHFLSRTAAIIAANAKAHLPIFEHIADNRLICLIKDCGLPDVLAAGVRRSILRNGGPTGSGYVYPVHEISFRWLNTLLPGCFVSHQSDNVYDASRLVSVARHSGGKMRLAWRNGRLELK